MKYFCLLCAILFACCVPVAAEQTYEHASAWECYGLGWGGFSSSPSGVAMDATGNVYVADTGKARIVKFATTGAYLVQWGTPGSGVQQFYAPIDIAVNSTGIVYVSDKAPTGNLMGDRIKRFTNTGRPFPIANNTWRTGSCSSVGGLGIDRSDNVYVADTGNNRILKYTPDGNLLCSWGSYGNGNGQFDRPTDVAVDGAGNVFVADRNNHRVQIFSPDGEYKGQWQGPSEAPFAALWGIATDSYGNVLVTDEYSIAQSPSRAWVFTARDTTLADWDGYQLPYTFYGPRGIAADSAGAIYVVNAGGTTRSVEKYVRAAGPTLRISGDSSVDEGTSYDLSMAATDLGDKTIASWEITWGDGSVEQVSGTQTSATHTYADGPATRTISATAIVEEATFRAKSINVTVQNVAPTPSIRSAPETSPEGTAITLTASAVDAGATDTSAGFTYAWSVTKDGKLFESGASGASFTFTPDDNGAYEVTLTATDKDGGQATTTAPIAATNVAPTIETIDVAGDIVTEIVVMAADAPRDYLGPFRADSPITVTVTFSDPGVPDTHTPVWNWGDGSAPSEQVGPRVRTLTATHTYTTPGFYTLSITLTDKDGGVGSLATLKPIVVYDPDGGSVTGGGWFTSPAGACTPENPDDADIVGKAHFAFASRYKTDATVPDSSVEFSLKQAKIDFKSTSVEWLVVDGAKAIYRGVGTLNGASGYRFLLSAIDDPSSDRIRVKVWTPSGVVYDSQPGAPDTASPSTEIGGGSIVIHP